MNNKQRDVNQLKTKSQQQSNFTSHKWSWGKQEMFYLEQLLTNKLKVVKADVALNLETAYTVQSWRHINKERKM